MMTVLVVDDSRITRMMLRSLLKQIRPDDEVLEADCGEAAMSAVNDDVHFAIIDYNMPGMNGLEVAAELKATIPDGHIVLCTANSQKVIQNRAKDLGVHFIAKPITPDKVRAIFETMEAAA
ncbi:MAG: response regulator [Deltaproteobacteria bacterium]|nr:response regulator [Deltaproteobacteria bacterium]